MFAIRDCVSFDPRYNEGNSYSLLNFEDSKISYDGCRIDSKIHHIIPVRRLREFFNGALRSEEVRPRFTVFLLGLAEFVSESYLLLCTT